MSGLPKEPPASHGFIVMGTEKLFLCHLPMFFMPEHNYQVILEGEINTKDMETYAKKKQENPSKPLIILNEEEMILKDLANSKSYMASLYFSNVDGDRAGNAIIKSTQVTVKKILLFEQLNPKNKEYPEKLTYYLYGSDLEYHLAHMLTKAPNFQQDLDVSLSEGLSNKMRKMNSGITKISIPSLDERKKQPIKNDPLSETEYKIIVEGDDGDDNNGTLQIGTKYWINNGPLNM